VRGAGGGQCAAVTQLVLRTLPARTPPPSTWCCRGQWAPRRSAPGS
jgi:hypothetical protein